LVSEGLDEDVVGGQERGALVQENLPDLPGFAMVRVVRIEDGQQGGGIDENRHSP
jgi:hypothetical protein